ncbi:MAG TPA: class I SAM-dependent methyltransferase [Verrucomicrobiae bacterium]|nr:class I SAM-dependent methyltransferase [Verrucomicrobiae bacterium]
MSFDRLAPYYRWMEFVLAGKKMQRCRFAFLDDLPPPHNILLLGEGHGRSLVGYRRRFAGAQITCVDASAGMLAQARQQLPRHGLSADRVDFIHADILSWVPPQNHYDLVVTSFFLDCFRPDQLEHIISKLARSLPSKAIWLNADFQIPATGWRRTRSRAIVWLLYRFFRVVTGLPARTLTKPDPFLAKAGFTLCHRNEMEWNLLHADWWQRPAGAAA